MKNHNLLKLLGLLALVAGLVLLAAPARAEMYVEGYVGGVQAANFNEPFIEKQGPTTYIINFPGKTDPAVIGGLKIGTWFVKEGFLGYNYPEWMKYFGFYTDFSFHRLVIRRTPVVAMVYAAAGAPGVAVPGVFQAEGYAATWAFMFTARYGFLQDSEVPFGRLQPYVAVGPAIMFTGFVPSTSLNWSSNSDATICLAVDAGVRWMCLKNVSLDVSFKYRYAEPQFDFSSLGGLRTASYGPSYHLFSGQVGVAYHF